MPKIVSDVPRLPDGTQVVAHQRDLALDLGPATGDVATALVTEHTIYAAVVGSRAFGLATAESDTDTRGVYVAPTPMFWSLAKPPTHAEGPGPDWFSWEIERFCELALKANPNLLEVLHSPLVVRLTPVGEELLGLRDAFVSQLAYQTFSGYAQSQFKKLEADLRQRGAPRWKHVMHLLRLRQDLDDALEHTRLPALPDVGRVDAWLRSVRARGVTEVSA